MSTVSECINVKDITVKKYLNSKEAVKDYEDWIKRLKDEVELQEDDVPKKSLVFLYLLYKDMYGTTDGPIHDDFKWMIETERIVITYRGVTNLMYLYDNVKIDSYIILLKNCLNVLEVPSEQTVLDAVPILNCLTDLDDIIISPTMEVRRAERTVAKPYKTIEGLVNVPTVNMGHIV